MEYKTKLEELTKLLDALASYDDEVYQEDFRQLKLLIEGLETNFKNYDIKEMELAEILKANYEYSKVLFKFYPYFRKFYKIGKNFYPYEINNYVYSKISNQDCLDLARIFFEEQGNFFTKQLERFYKEAKDHLSFIRPNDYTDGQITYLNTSNEAFVIIPDHKNFKKVITAVHELEHVIDAYNNPKFHSAYMVREATALTLELIASDRINSLLGTKKENLKRRYELDSVISTDASLAYYNFQLLHHLKKFNGNENELFNYFNSKGFIKADVLTLNSSTLFSQCYYQIAYMIAVEIYTLYGKDKELALYIIKQIVMKANSDNIIDLLDSCGIHLNENMHGYKENLEKELIKKNAIKYCKQHSFLFLQYIFDNFLLF